ncbi:hypothetical protein BISA_1573 [Bifidobacterium saguini DSM 23967]|uniref:Uncharacterized protein n=2 Tax=Bifidobacterium saguini TaxID=762210 RepID=A0A087DD85_9BIFI|nr:hypothetical protein [Bifidobacterium saguini]KFI93485.1 hypothetical protein BISA_1573 [Bifidobacterium saguini DSM 23967]QTB90672.1 hypothetical protein BSD967_10290 [Bifidobacterium saguini]
MARIQPMQQAQPMPEHNPAHNQQQALDAFDTLQALDADRAKIASGYAARRTSNIVWIAIVFGLLTFTYWLIPQAWFNRFNLPWNPIWLVAALLVISLLLLTAAIMLNSRRQGIAPQWQAPKPAMRSRRYKVAIVVHFLVNFIPPCLALAVGFATTAWWSAVAVTLVGAVINGAMQAWECDEIVRALQQRTAPNPSALDSLAEAHHGIG